MNKIGLIDFWYYVNEEFFFNNGHMLLRGSNGSGKSVTMQSFIPLLLDGNKSSERLDAFGTRSRKLENYLIEEEGNRDDRIGYLYLEFKREDSELYKTIGIGLHARRYKPLDSWYFVIEDNRRINKDVFLMENDLAITKQMLKTRIPNQVYESQKEYMAKVNQTLFGFDSMDEYKEVINLLLQLRSPKLSNSLKPTSINEILSNSLQPLSEDDLRPMSEAITNMDDIKDQLDTFKQSLQAAKTISIIYEQYNITVLQEKLECYIMEDKKRVEKQKEIESLQKEIASLQVQYQEQTNLAQELNFQKEMLENEKRTLVNANLQQLVEDLDGYKSSLMRYKEYLEKKQNQEDKKADSCLDNKNKLKRYSDEVENYYGEIEKNFKELCSIEEELQFSEHDIIKNEVMAHPEVYFDDTYTKKCIDDEMSELKVGLQYFQIINDLLNQKQDRENRKEEELLHLEIVEKDIQNYHQLYLDTLEEYKEKFFQINRGHQFMKLSELNLKQVIDFLQRYELEDNYHEINRILTDLYHEVFNKLESKKIHLNRQLSDVNDRYKEIDKEYHIWENQTELEPSLTQDRQTNRAYLDEQKIAYKPLFSLLEFDDNTLQATRDRWEESLDKAGLLNALVINESSREIVLSSRKGMSDYYIFTTKLVDQLESCYLKEDEKQLLNIEKMLQEIGVKSSALKLTKDYIEASLLTITLTHTQENFYIGKLAREKLRQQKLRELSKQKEALLVERTELEKQLNIHETNVQIFEKEYSAYPVQYDLSVALKMVKDNENEQTRILKNIGNIETEIRKINEKISIQNKTIIEIANRLKINANESTFKLRYSNFEDYRDLLSNFLNKQNRYATRYEMLTSVKTQYEEALMELDTLRAERIDLEKNVQRLNHLIAQACRQLEEAGYANIQQRVNEISDLLLKLPKQLEENQIMIGELRNSLKISEDKQGNLAQELFDQNELTQKYYTYYKDEALLRYCLSEEMDIKNIKQISAFLHSKKTSQKRKEILMGELQTTVSNQRGFLQDYNLVINSLFQDEEDKSMFRITIFVRYKGSSIHFNKLIVGLEKDIETQSLLLEQRDQELIEDIIVNNMSRKIRRLISNSEKWVEDMNHFMNTMNTSSGLRLNLEWKSRKAESDEELSSQQLVKLLRTDISLLKQKDLEQLSTHFRSKITAARKISDKEEISESFHQIMKKIMDYRTWFDFTILYEKTGEKRKELTNNAFFAFSGGEKAMSMYVPLFSAVAAKFMGANEDAPLLIALDEAFAGVDEKNIDNMFSLIAKFGFDYIMNSQVLWGDYPSVKALAMHELFRPENAHYVTVISYTWNGYIKELVNI